MTTEQKRVRVSLTASQRLREIVLMDYVSRTDQELAKLINDRLPDAPDPLVVIDTAFPDAPTRVFELSFAGRGPAGEATVEAFAIMRDGCIVTMFDAKQVSKNIGNRRWLRPDDPELVASSAAAAIAIDPRPAAVAPVPRSPAVRVTPEREELHVAIPLDLAQLGVNLVEAEIAAARAWLASESAASAAVEAATLHAAAVSVVSKARDAIAAAAAAQAKAPRP